MDSIEQEHIQHRLAALLEQMIEQYGDTPELRLIIANYVFGYLGVSYGLHVK